MIKLAIIDDGIPILVARKFTDICVKYFYVNRRNIIRKQRIKQYIRKISHAGICFMEYANFVEHGLAEVYSIDIGVRKTGKLQSLIAALNWCEKNGINIVNLSVGSKCYWDYFLLEPVLKKMSEKNILIIAAHSNDYRISFPAFSNYVVSTRFDSGNILEMGKCAVIDTGLLNKEFVVSKTLISDSVKKYVDVGSECNSFSAPFISALYVNQFSKNQENCEKDIMRLHCDKLWDLRKSHMINGFLEIPLLLFIGEETKVLNILKELMMLFLGRKYTVIALCSVNTETEFPFLNLQNILENCNNDIKNAMCFMAEYSNVDLLMAHVNNTQADVLLEFGFSEIVVYTEQMVKIGQQIKKYNGLTDLFNLLISVLT